MSSSKHDVIFAVCIAPIIIYAGYNEFSDLSEEIEISRAGPDEMCVICENKSTDQSSTIAIEISLISLGISITLIFKKKNNEKDRSATGRSDSGDSGSGVGGSEGKNELANKIIDLQKGINQLISDQKNNMEGFVKMKTEIEKIKDDYDEIKNQEKIGMLDKKITQLLNRFNEFIINQKKHNEEIVTVNTKIDEIKVENDEIKNQLKRIRDSKADMVGVSRNRLGLEEAGKEF